MIDPILFQQLMADVAKDVATIAMTNIGFREDVAAGVAVQTITAVMPRLASFNTLLSRMSESSMPSPEFAPVVGV